MTLGGRLLAVITSGRDLVVEGLVSFLHQVAASVRLERLHALRARGGVGCCAQAEGNGAA